MDWDYIFSISPEDLTEEEKDELYNMVTWFNNESEDLNLTKTSALLRLSQEILKYKGEQVEVLLHKLDELATQQGEEEVKRLESDTDGRSSKSRKSSSIEFENLEQKYIELRAKYKKQVKINERNCTEISKLKKKLAALDQEKNRLISEMQLMNQDDNHSDISETFKEQHKELVQTLHNKNKQISNLLHDIEETDKENMVLREKLATVRDELTNATKELTLSAVNHKAIKIEMEESSEIIKKLNAENETLRDEAREALEQKRYFEREMEEFTEEVNVRVDEWKKILGEKEKEINELKSRQVQQSSIRSSMSSLPQDKEQLHMSTLNKILGEREKQLLEVKAKLQEAVKEMEESTEIIKELTTEKESNKTQIHDLSISVKELKKQLKATHERCQNFQDDLVHTEEIVQEKDADLKEILATLKSDGYSDLAENLGQIQQLKGQNRMQEKQIMDLVKAANKLQENCDEYEKEIEVLRDRLGIAPEEIVSTATIPVKQKQQKKELLALRKQIEHLEEEKLQLKSQIHQQNRTISGLSNQLLEIGENPEDAKLVQTPDAPTKTEIKALVEENEALRKGLHEVLDSVNHKKETTIREVKSETFEKLLRALDVRHVAGWYHPAMRLQAELHNQEGINAELREQLRLMRLEKSQKSDEDEKLQTSSTFDVLDSAAVGDAFDGKDLATLNNIQKSLQDLLVKLDRDSESTTQIETKLLSYKQSFVEIHQQIGVLYAEYMEEKKSAYEELSKCRETLTELEESNAVKEAKIDLLTKECSGEESAVSKALDLAAKNVVLNRKCVYLENEIKWLHDRVIKLQNDLGTAQSNCLNKINNLSNKNKVLAITVTTLTNKLEQAADPQEFNELRKDFDNLTIKYRVLLGDFSKLGGDKELETKMLEESRKMLEREKTELKNKIADLCVKLHSCENFSGRDDERIETLCKKLATTEINEITERQRANHTNNLYELVKEQFQKSEENCKLLEAHNREVAQRNLLLQEQLKDLESKMCNYVDVTLFNSLQNKYDELMLAHEQLKGVTAINATSKSLNEVEPNSNVKWTLAREDELLSLKHQIVDLQAACDDKMQIARLTTDLNHLRLQENESSHKIEALIKELRDCETQRDGFAKKLEITTTENQAREIEIKKKIGALRIILEKQKQQYLGCVPLVSEEKFIENVKQAIIDKHEAFINLYDAQICDNESSILKEQYETELKNLENILKSIGNNPDQIREILSDAQEKRMLQFSELKYRRQFKLKDTQLQHVFDRVKIQDDLIIKLEEELFNLHKNYNVSFDSDLDPPPVVIQQEKLVKNDPPMIKITKCKESQTIESEEDVTPTSNEEKIASLRTELMSVNDEISTKNRTIEQLKSKISEQEMNISLFRKQLGDKQSQITFYERHILELQSKKEVTTIPVTNEEVLSLKCSIKTFQEKMKDKDEEILNYQSLLKEDRDKHSLAASLMRDDLKMLQKCLAEEKKKYSELKSTLDAVHPGKAVLEQYFVQVHSLEDELAELRTKVSGLESQLQASRSEAVRWRALANDRLESMQQLGKDLDDVHRSEIIAYKNDSEKWREEVTNLKQMISKYRSDMAIDFDFQKLLKEKDDKIHELTVLLRSTKSESRKAIDRPDVDTASKLIELESAKEQLLKEHEAIKKRFDQLLIRERSAREEIRDLRGKLMKKPILSARSDKSDRSIKEQLQKKVTSLENEIVELKENLERQVAINESHRIKISEDFDRWNKQKHWQQLAEKLKDKLKAKETDLDKLQQTCAGYRILIERLEREKYNLESRIKSLKTGNNQISNNEIEMLQIDNMKLINENEALTSKLEMQQHHAGGLGAAMLQEKLEAQERKIAILELSNKGTAEVRSELERLQHIISSLQKSNLRLEAENLELKVDMEKYNNETPHLRQQIQHLENYIEVLKNETVQKDTGENLVDPRAASKKVSELERTIFVLKRVVEKLQAENKRLVSGKRPYPDRSGSGEKLKRDYQRLKEQYCESLQKVSHLEQELKSINSVENKHIHDKLTALSDELTEVKEQLEQKSHLLSKVRVLLQRAAMKEKTLLQEIAELRGKVELPENGSDL